MSIINLSFSCISVFRSFFLLYLSLSLSFISFFPLFFSSVINLSVFFSVFHFFCPFFNLLPKSPSIYPAGSKIHFAAFFFFFFFFFVAIRSFFLLSNILCIIFHPSLGHSIKKICFCFWKYQTLWQPKSCRVYFTRI